MTAALFHVQFGAVQPSRGDRLHKVAAYNAAARVQAPGGAVYDFRRKSAEHVGGCLMLPAGAPAWAADPAHLWFQAETAETRVDGQPARLVEFAIPREVPPARRLEFARAVVAPWVADEGVAAQIDLHCPPAADGGEQPHAHVILTRRALGPDGFAARKTNNAPWTHDKGRTMRAAVADRMNRWLADQGCQSRVDHRSHVGRGDLTPPEPDVGRRAIEAYKRDPDDADAFSRVLADRPKRRALRAATAEREAAETEIQHLEKELRHDPARRPDPGSHAFGDTDRDPGRARRHDQNPRPADPAVGRGRGRPDRQNPGDAGRGTGIAGDAPRQNRRPRLPASVELVGGPLRSGDGRVTEARLRLREADGRAARHRRAGARRAAEQAAFRVPRHPADDRLAAARRQLADTLPPSIAPGDAAERRRRRERHLAGLLREHYGTGWLPESVATNLLRVELDRTAGTATLHLRGGSRLVDHGDRLVLHGRPREAAVAELVTAVERHRWSSVTLTGAPAFRVAVAAALADRRPPVSVVGLDEANQQAVAAELARRAEKRHRVALDALRAAERDHLARLAGRQPTARDTATLEAVRDAQAAASRGDDAAVRAAAEGDIEGAVRAGAAWRRREEAPAARAVFAAVSEPATDGPQSPTPAYRPSWAQGPQAARLTR